MGYDFSEHDVKGGWILFDDIRDEGLPRALAELEAKKFEIVKIEFMVPKCAHSPSIWKVLAKRKIQDPIRAV